MIRLSLLGLLLFLGGCNNNTQELPAAHDQDTLIQQALVLQLPAPSTIESKEADAIDKQTFQKVSDGSYKDALATVLAGLQKYPDDFGLQARFASVFGDYSGNFSGDLKEQMISRAKALFEKLFQEASSQSKPNEFFFKNEYFYRFARYKEQYELGLEKASYYSKADLWNNRRAASSYYSQGVGAANYARVLIEQDSDTALALDYAQKALVAWAQYFSYDNTYYNSYVHYAMALGILGYADDMMKALHHAADLIRKDLNFHEFKEVLEFYNAYIAKKTAQPILTTRSS